MGSFAGNNGVLVCSAGAQSCFSGPTEPLGWNHLVLFTSRPASYALPSCLALLTRWNNWIFIVRTTLSLNFLKHSKKTVPFTLPVWNLDTPFIEHNTMTHFGWWPSCHRTIPLERLARDSGAFLKSCSVIVISMVGKTHWYSLLNSWLK